MAAAATGKKLTGTPYWLYALISRHGWVPEFLILSSRTNSIYLLLLEGLILGTQFFISNGVSSGDFSWFVFHNRVSTVMGLAQTLTHVCVRVFTMHIIEYVHAPSVHSFDWLGFISQNRSLGSVAAPGGWQQETCSVVLCGARDPGGGQSCVLVM